MTYYDPEDKRPVRWASAAAAAYMLLLLMAFLLVTFDFTPKELPGQGLLVLFGTTDRTGTSDLQTADSTPALAPAAAPTPPVEEFVTAEQSDVMVPEQSSPHPTPAQPASGTEPTPSADAEPQRQTVNRRALFPGRAAASASASAGTIGGAGNEGDPAGSPDGSPQGTGHSDMGPTYDLTGRSVVGALPVPRYTADATGKVIVDVTVDASGRVMSAAYRSQGSTTNNSELVAAALAAARKARFSESETIVQGGTITYIFRMN